MIVLLLLATVLPTLLYVTILWWLDKYEKEPWGLFLAAFAYGCVPAVILSLIFEVAVETSGVLDMLIIAPVIEEYAKGMAVLLIFLLWRREFDGVLDGIIYGAVVGFGFAMVENFLYFLDAGGDIVVVLLRTVPFGLNHAFFTAFTGAGLGLARQSRHRWLWVLLFPLSLGVAIAFHALHNYSVGAMGCLGLLLALVSNWGGIVVILVVAVLSWGQEKRWVQQELAEEVAAGLLAEADQQALLSLRRRIGARLWVWRHHGWRAFRLMGQFFDLATDLAFRKHHLRNEPADERMRQQVVALRQRVRDVRTALLALRGNA